MTYTAEYAPTVLADAKAPEVPAYLRETYTWAYLRPSSLLAFDNWLVVSAILLGNYVRLKRAAFAEISPGQSVLQPACVYGRFSPDLAALVGPKGRLDVTDIAPIQVENCRRKLADLPHARVRAADAADPGGGPYDAVCCFFLLHELPDAHKRKVIDGLLSSLAPGGKVIFVDYHKPAAFHPLKSPMSVVFDRLEPFAKALWDREISSFATAPERFSWRKEIYFGGLYQKVVAEIPMPAEKARERT
jgi:SAM-dependent methyltransferase